MAFLLNFMNVKTLLALLIVGIIVLGGLGYFMLSLQPAKAPSSTSTSVSTISTSTLTALFCLVPVLFLQRG